MNYAAVRQRVDYDGLVGEIEHAWSPWGETNVARVVCPLGGRFFFAQEVEFLTLDRPYRGSRTALYFMWGGEHLLARLGLDPKEQRFGFTLAAGWG